MNLKTELNAQLQVLSFLIVLIVLFGYSVFSFRQKIELRM